VKEGFSFPEPKSPNDRRIHREHVKINRKRPGPVSIKIIHSDRRKSYLKKVGDGLYRLNTEGDNNREVKELLLVCKLSIRR